MDPEACTICLEPFDEAAITRLQPCAHHYHTHCIDGWREHSNQCPTCRSHYEIVERISATGTVLSTVIPTRVEAVDKQLLFEENLMTTQESVREDVLQRRIEQLVGQFNTCVLCDETRGHVMSCHDCSSTFHFTCLGLNDERQWFCPVCSCEQRTGRNHTSRFRRSRMSERTNTVYNMLTDNGRESNICVMEERVIERSAVSVEEQNAWSQFEQARKDEGDSTGIISQETNCFTRKQKPPSHRGRNQRQSQVKEAPKIRLQGSSLVERVLDEMKSNTRPVHLLSLESNLAYNDLSQSPQLPTSSLRTFVEDQVITNKSAWKMPIDNNGLTYEQKATLQEIVRHKLRPIYRAGDISEDQYTEINKRVSRVLYETFLRDNGIPPNFEQIAEDGIQRELMNLW